MLLFFWFSNAQAQEFNPTHKQKTHTHTQTELGPQLLHVVVIPVASHFHHHFLAAVKKLPHQNTDQGSDCSPKQLP